MPVRLQLEGQDLESLLERVQDEYGARARIVEAEKLRTGGVGGFFAKERFAMTVELDEDGAVGPVTVPDDPSSLLDLVDAASRHEVSTSSAAFGDVLNRVAASSGTPYDEFVAAPVPPSVARPRRPVLPPPRSATSARTAAPVIAPDPVVEPAPAAKPAGRTRKATTVKPTPRKPRPRPKKTARPPATPSVARRLRELGLPEPLVPARTADLHRTLVRALAALPTALEPDLSPGRVLLLVGPAAAALEAARRLSTELDLEPSAVVLCAPTAVLGLVPVKQRADGPRRLAALVESAARRARPLVIAVDERVATAEQGARHGWSTGVSALCPAATRWGVVSATTKTSDVNHWTQRVGGLDGLWVDGIEDSGDPATVLGADVPAARLDGRKATPAAWASLLCERLA